MGLETPFTRREFLSKSGTAGLAVAAGAMVACGSSGTKKTAATGSKARGSGEVVVISWGDPQKVDLLSAAFKQETGINLRYIPGDNDNDFYTKVKAGGGDQYDVVVCNVGYAPLYEKAGLTEVLDLTQFPAHKELYPEFRTDRRFQYLKGPDKSLVFPNTWGVYALTYSTTAPFQPKQPVSWEELWKAPKGKVVLNGNYVTNVAMAGRLQGLSWDDAFKMEGPTLDKAVQRLRDLKPFLVLPSEQAVIDGIRTGSIDIGMHFGIGFADTIKAKVGKDIAKSVIPTEGTIGALDGQVLLKGARNRENALKFINFLGGKRAQLIQWDLYKTPTANRVATEAILARGGADAASLKSQHGDEPSIAAAMSQIRQPANPDAWNKAWDHVLAS
jgi:spermidine/putrescine transport system substrate-binding protein